MEPQMSAAPGAFAAGESRAEKATPNKGGHRTRAIQLVDQAMEQVKKGERYYEEHQGK